METFERLVLGLISFFFSKTTSNVPSVYLQLLMKASSSPGG